MQIPPLPNEMEWSSPDRTFECAVVFEPEDSGGFSIYAASLPGVASQGDTEENAIANIAEALQGVIADYIESGDAIPWKEKDLRPCDPNVRWVRVDV